MSFRKVLLSFWKDPVFSTIIANMLLTLPGILTLLSPYISDLGNIVKMSIPIYYTIIIFLLMLLAISLLVLKVYKIKKELVNQNIIQLELLRKQKEIDYIDNNERFKMFKIGDVVKMKTAPISNCIKYTVIDKNINGITLVDMNNNKIICHPEAVMTSDEYIKENNEWCDGNKRARQMTIGKWI